MNPWQRTGTKCSMHINAVFVKFGTFWKFWITCVGLRCKGGLKVFFKVCEDF
jgi:hypothetical protein